MNFMIQKILHILISKDWCMWGDVIRSTDSFRETVIEVSFDGSFYTEMESEPYDLLNEAEETLDEKK